MYKEPNKLHDPKLDPRIKRGFVTFELDPGHYLKEFMPAWKRYVLFWKILAAIWVSMILILLFFPDSMKSLYGIWIFLVIASLVSGGCLALTLQCPKCQCFVAFASSYYIFKFGWWWPWETTRPYFILTGECPNCGVKLKNRLLSDKAIILLVVSQMIASFLALMIVVVYLLIRGK